MKMMSVTQNFRVLSCTYESFASIIRHILTLEAILDLKSCRRRTNRLADFRFVNPWMLVSSDPSRLPEPLQ
jgi:hypothetical protein